jgi:RNA polymerase sigma-70 factor (ECF subfamily)
VLDERSDAELLAASALGDGDAFAHLVRRHIRAATLLAAQLVRDRDDAEDLVQEAFTVVHRRARDLDREQPFAPWLFAVVRRLAANRRTRDQRRAGLLRRQTREGAFPSAAPSAEEVTLARLDLDVVRQAMEHLPAMQRACFELVTLRELSVDTVATMHGISESTVRQHVFRARAALREAIGGEAPRHPRRA